MKPCFLKLTQESGEEVYINMNTIDFMGCEPGRTGLSQQGQDCLLCIVKETPEQIINMLKAVK